MENDDHPRGRLLTRREALALMGMGGVMWLAGCKADGSGVTNRQNVARNTPACVVRPEQTEGPYFVDERLNRSDVRSDPTDGTIKDGVPLDLTFKTSSLRNAGCVPLADAVVDIWSCDALGVYSDVRDPNFDTVGKKFLRGYQITDANGNARFTTIYPGWYPGRTVHVHFKIRSSPAAQQGYEFTSQLYFDETVTDRVHARQPYAQKGRRTLRNADDGIFSDGGSDLLLEPIPNAKGYAATFEVALA